MPLRERNILLDAAGFAPVYAQRPLADPGLAAARRAIDLVLKGHEPYPGAGRRPALDHAGGQRRRRAALAARADLLRPPVNVLRLSLHPRGPRPAHRKPCRMARPSVGAAAPSGRGDARRRAGRADGRTSRSPAPPVDPAFEDRFGGVAVPLRLRSGAGILSFLSTTTVFGTPRDITLAELALESFFPADEATAATLAAMRPD